MQVSDKEPISPMGLYYEKVSFNPLRATSGIPIPTAEFPEHGLVRDGTPCGENLVCVNQTCVSLFPYIDTSKCPTNQNNIECAGNGVIVACFSFTLN